MIFVNPHKMNWSSWFPLSGAGRNSSVPRDAGIYRIRRTGQESLDYVGQTGSTVGTRERLGMLGGVYKAEMPFNDPHTAGPALWALRQLENCEYEASVATLPNATTPLRKGLECLIIANHRQVFGRSPTFNFGRMPLGYSKSAGRGRGRRGEETQSILPCHILGLGPIGAIEQQGKNKRMLGLDWSTWSQVEQSLESLSKGETGLYMFRPTGSGNLSYIGEGKILDRVKAHLKKGSQPDHRQFFAFSDQKSIELSYIVNSDWEKHQRLEIENDLIAAHVIQWGEIPSAQFLG